MPNNILGFGSASWLKPSIKPKFPFQNYMEATSDVPEGIHTNYNEIENMSKTFEDNLKSQVNFSDPTRLYNSNPTNNVANWKTSLSKVQGVGESSKVSGGLGLSINDITGAGMGIISGISNIKDIQNSGMTSDSKRMQTADSITNSAAQIAGAFGPVGKAVGMGLGLVNSIGGALIGTPKQLKDFNVNDQVATSSSYTGVGSQAKDVKESAGTYASSGLFGKLFGGKKKLIGKTVASNYDQTKASGILNTNKSALESAANSQDMYANNYINQINGTDRNWTNGSIMYGQQGGIIFNPLSKPLTSITEFDDINLLRKEEAPIKSSRLDQLAEERRITEQKNIELEKQLNSKSTEVETESPNTLSTNNNSANNKFSEFENAGLQILQKLNPGKKVEIKFENSGVYNSDGSRNFATQAALLKKGASKTALSLHNFGAARDYRIVIDGKVVSPSNTQLYKDVVWGAAKQTGLHTIGEWDVAHVGLAQEGTGRSWNDLAEKFPDIFKTQLAKDTIEGLKKSGQSKYLNQLSGALSKVGYSKEGGKIHIKEENKGKFTEYKKRTGKTTEEALHSKDPKVRKMANFAKNAKKFKHQEGGQLLNGYITKSKEQLQKEAYLKQYGSDPKVIDPMDELLSVPQKGTTWAVTGKYQAPSDAIGIQNPYGKAAVDFVLDPTNLFLFSKVNKIRKIAEEAEKFGAKGALFLSKNAKMREAQRLSRIAAQAQAKTMAGRSVGLLALDKSLDLEGNVLGNDSKQFNTVRPGVDISYDKVVNGTTKFKTGGTIKPKSVIVHGALHAHKHTLKELKELREAEITLKGIPVVTMAAEGGTIDQQAEVEREELVLHHALTMQLEELRKDGSDEAAVKAGKLLARELMRNTKDKTGTLRSIRDKGKELKNV